LVNNQSNRYFYFEDDFIRDLRCIPLCVRRKLDLIGIKLKLTHWQEFNLTEKSKIVNWPDSRKELLNLKEFLKDKTSNSKYGEAKEIKESINEPWQNNTKVPYKVLKAAQKRGINISDEKWKNLSELDRFAFCKLIRPSHEHNNLDKAFDEILK
tara:strand:- start:559 stop:1020 length:462 start_codon:yes stop_codon:yes gene_type:complete